LAGEYREILRVLNTHRGGVKSLVDKLDEAGLHHLSYSKVACLESCPYCYFLQYVRKVKPKYEPYYFAKGRMFHQAAAQIYRQYSRGKDLCADDIGAIARLATDCEFRVHLTNAVETLRQNAFSDWDVVGIEKIFTLDLGREMPPVVGVIDLVLKKGNVYAVVDHKTGKDFRRQDPMQLAIYREYVNREYGPERCMAYFDSYRWVNNLSRIRKPVFEREVVRFRPESWGKVLRRLQKGYHQMLKIEYDRDAPGTGFCDWCSMNTVCDKVRYTTW
jgi:predicted RecB family nuclease